MKTVVTKWNSRSNSIQQLLYDGQRSTPTSPDILVLVMMTAITLLLRCKILMDSSDLRYPQPYPLPGIFPTTLPEPYSKSKSPTRQSLEAFKSTFWKNLGFWLNWGPFGRCPKMGLLAPKSKNGDYFFTPISPQNGGQGICFMCLPLLDEK